MHNEIYMHQGITNKIWGYEKLITNTPYHCGKTLIIYPNNKTSSMHYHKKKVETLHILKGYLRLQTFVCKYKQITTQINDWGLTNEHTMPPGMSITLNPGLAHKFWALNELAEAIEISTHETPDDTIRIEYGGDIPRNNY